MDNNNSIAYQNQKILPVDIEREMKKSYIDYAMSVIVGRALPDVRDGLKPVHRRILYTMFEDGLYPERGYRKSATTVGDVLGRYHPHGDMAVYDSLVRMAQDFSLRYPLVDGHGNFGSVDGDPAAAYRYTEARMSRLSMEMLTDIQKETVDYVDNYDGEYKEPSVLPSRFPNLLVNGSMGIAVGMTTNIPPHNLTEVIDAINLLIENPEAGLDEIMECIKGPDFPTGGIIMGRVGIRQAYYTGRGRAIVRARAEIEEHRDNRFRIVVTELPYMVNKARLIENIANLVKDKRIEGISDLRDESDRDGMRMVVELKRDANPQVVLNQLYNYTQLQDTFSIILLALVNNQPVVLNIKEMLNHYLEFQKEVIVRRTKYDLKKAEERAHILEGLKIAIDNIDEVVRIVRQNKNIPDAKQALMDRFELSDVQAQAIVDMRLGRLTGLERDKIEAEYNDVMAKIQEYRTILSDEKLVLEILSQELSVIKDKFGDERRSEIVAVADEIDIEDLIKEEDCVITMTHFGYIKRQPESVYKAQRRGGRGVTSITTREEDFVETLVLASTHDYMCFFTSKGRMFKIKGYSIPESGRTAKGTNIVNLLQIEQDEKITAMIPVRSFEDENSYLTMVTSSGTIKKTALSAFGSNRKGGIIAIVLNEDDELIKVAKTDGEQSIILGTRLGMAIRFKESDVRPMGRVSAGVRGIRLGEGDYIVGMCLATETGKLLTVTENGFGKRTELSEYKIQNRGGRGVTNYNITEKTGLVCGIKVVDESDDVMLISDDGTIIRMPVDGISVFGRITQGVIMMRVGEGIKVVNLCVVAKEDIEDEEQDGEGEEETGDEAEVTAEANKDLQSTPTESVEE